MLNNVNIIDYEIAIQGKTFIITFNKNEAENLVEIKNEKIYIKEAQKDEEYLKALIRGAFLGAGSMNNPQNKYHIEMAFKNKFNADAIAEVLKEAEITVKYLHDKNYCLYIKDGEEISKFLAFIGASSSMLKFEEIRVMREMSNKVNRLVNCETANLNKTINASVEQIEAIKYLKETNNFEKLNDNLKEIAEVRLEHPDCALSELGAFLKEPVGKSGVNYRLKKIIEIAENLKK